MSQHTHYLCFQVAILDLLRNLLGMHQLGTMTLLCQPTFNSIEQILRKNSDNICTGPKMHISIYHQAAILGLIGKSLDMH